MRLCGYSERAIVYDACYSHSLLTTLFYVAKFVTWVFANRGPPIIRTKYVRYKRLYSSEKGKEEEQIEYEGSSGLTQSQSFILSHFGMWTKGDEEETEKKEGEKKTTQY